MSALLEVNAPSFQVQRGQLDIQVVPVLPALDNQTVQRMLTEFTPIFHQVEGDFARGYLSHLAGTNPKEAIIKLARLMTPNPEAYDQAVNEIYYSELGRMNPFADWQRKEQLRAWRGNMIDLNGFHLFGTNWIDYQKEKKQADTYAQSLVSAHIKRFSGH